MKMVALVGFSFAYQKKSQKQHGRKRDKQTGSQILTQAQRKFVLFCLVVCSVLMPKLAAQTFPNPDIIRVPNKLMVKVKKDALGSEQSPEVLTRSVSFLQILEKGAGVAVERIDNKYARMTAPSYERLSPQKRALAQEIALYNLYEITLSSDQDLERALQNYAAQTWVEYAEPIYTHQLMLSPPPPFIPNDPYVGSQWHLNRCQVYDAWGLHQGDTSVVVGIIDTGIKYDHVDLDGAMQYNYAERYGILGVDDDGNGFVDDSLGYNFGDMNPNSFEVHNHGTAVSGMAACETNNGVGIAAVGNKVRLMPLRVMDMSGQIVNTYDAILYGAENGCTVLNLSLGRPNLGFQWEQDIIAYVTLVKNVSVVASAGNTSAEWDFYPASYKYVLSVVHTNSADQRHSPGTFSTNIDLMAPGRLVFTTRFTGAYVNATGSSFAAPMVAGAVALVRSAFPELNAMQANMLVRATTDNTYGIAANAPFVEKLGTGRLNVFKALSLRNTAKCIRVDGIYPQTSQAGYIFSGDTVTLHADFINYLNPTTNATVTVSTSSPFITFLDNTFSLGDMAEMQLKGTQTPNLPFRFVVAPNAPNDLVVKLRFGFTDAGGYSDYQYLPIRINSGFMNVDFNRISLTVSGNSRQGHYDIYNSQGIGINFNGQRVLNEGGLVVALSPTQVSNNILTNLPNLLKDEDFKMLEAPRLTAQEPFYTEAQTVYTDTIGAAPPVGVAVKQVVRGKTNTPHHQYVIVEYEIENLTGNLLDSLLVGLYLDWDIQNKNSNLADWDNARGMGYVYQSGGLHAGVKMLENSPRTYFALDLTNVGGSNINVTDGFLRSEKFATLSQRIGRTQAGFSVGGNDVAHLVGTVLFNFLPNEKRKVRFVLALSNTLAQLRSLIDGATVAENPQTALSPTPEVDSTFCGSPPYVIAPSGGTNFRFYRHDNTETPVHIGTAYTLPDSELGELYYITCVDSTLEGGYKAVRFYSGSGTNAAIVSASIFNKTDSSAMNFYGLSSNAVSWNWSFGDGFGSSQQNPIHAYAQAGTYVVTLTVVDALGCSATTSKVVTVIDRPAPPVLQRLYTACWQQPILLTTPALTTLRLYDKNNPSVLLQESDSLWIDDPLLTQVLVTQVVNGYESLPVEVRIARSLLNPDFEAIPQYDTILFSDVVFIDRTESRNFIISKEWDFGDGSPLAYGSQVYHEYAQEGDYEVTLRVRDNLGCVSILKRVYKVGRKSPTPLFPRLSYKCKGEPFTIAPTNGNVFRFYHNQNDPTPFHIGRSYTLPMPTEGTFTVWVSNMDNRIESERVKIEVIFRQAQANFDVQREVNLDENRPLQFLDQSQLARQWFWEFGDGSTASERNPVHTYTAQGVYNVRLTITDVDGCVGVVEKAITAFRRSPLPLIADRTICRGDSVRLTPSGGTNFRFYDSEFSSTPVHQGRFYDLGWIFEEKTLFVTNIDSMIESPAKRVRISFSKPKSDFTTSRDTINRFYNDTLVLENRSERALNWYWFFGDGRRSQEENPRLTYEAAGKYRIDLITQDILGCTDTLSRHITVLDTPTISVVEDGKYAILIYPNPTRDILQVYIDSEKAQETYIVFTDQTGKEILLTSKELVKGRQYTFDLGRLAAGIYHLQIRLPDAIIHRKILKL
jgi:PKD repeat protein/subtilisin family serine protease